MGFEVLVFLNLYARVKCDFSPTAIGLGSSAIVKVSGQNSFRILYCSLEQIRLGLPKGSAESSTKVPPRFHRGSTKVSRRLRKFHDLSGLLGQIPFVFERFPSLVYTYLPVP